MITELIDTARQMGRQAFDTAFLAGLPGRFLVDDNRLAVLCDGPMVPYADTADVLLLVDGDGLFAAEDVVLTPVPSAYGPLFRVDAVPGERIGDAAAVVPAMAKAAVLLAADAVGAAEAALEHTVDRVLAREQWGKAIATFQAVQHRCADMLTDVVMARDAVLDAAATVDRTTDVDEIVLAAAYAKPFAIERCRRVTAAAHQLHGGAGILASSPLHRWYRRVKAAESMYGTPRHHREVVARSVLG